MLGVVFNDQDFLGIAVQDVFYFFEDFLKLFKGHRLVDKINGSFQQTLVLHLVRRHDMHRNGPGLRVGFQGVHHLPAAHDRQLNIEQNTQRFVDRGQL